MVWWLLGAGYSALRFWATGLPAAVATEVDTVLLTADGVLRPTIVGFPAAFFALVVVVTGLFGRVLPDAPGFAVRASFVGMLFDDAVAPLLGALVVDVSVPATDTFPSGLGLPMEPEMVV